MITFLTVYKEKNVLSEVSINTGQENSECTHGHGNFSFYETEVWISLFLPTEVCSSVTYAICMGGGGVLHLPLYDILTTSFCQKAPLFTSNHEKEMARLCAVGTGHA